MWRKFMRYALLICLLIATSSGNAYSRNTTKAQKDKTPKLTIVIIIDQFAYNYLYKLRPFLTGGIHYLLKHGTVYENAHYPYALPETAPGHTSLQTGTLPKDHGIIANEWYEKNKLIKCDDDESAKGHVFGQEHNAIGKSPKNIMVDGLSDQFMLQNQPDFSHNAISLSLKSRAAICTAGSLGKAIWFDTKTGQFTSSKAYFDSLASWVTLHNQTTQTIIAQGCTWEKAYPNNPRAYNFHDISNYTFADDPQTLIGTKIAVNQDAADSYSPFERTPCANQLLINLAKECINHYCTKKSNTLLWLSLSSLDLLAHRVGPYAMDAIDMLYHIDQQLKNFINHAIHAVGKQNILFVLTSDHGVVPIQGILQEHKLEHVHRYKAQELIENLNASVEESDTNPLVIGYSAPGLYFDTQVYNKLDSVAKSENIQVLKNQLLSMPGIKNVWTQQELKSSCFDATHELESYYKNQLYPGRSGQLIIQPQPYCLISSHRTGTTHETPFNYDTHVPLVVYQPGRTTHTKIVQKVYMTQVANTLAQLLNTPKPSASTADVLPGIFNK